MSDNPQQAVVQRKGIRDLLNSGACQSEIAKVLPKHLTAERITRVALTAITRTPKLLDCRPESLMNALMVCSQAGLEPDGRLAHLIPFGQDCQVIFDWKGLVTLGLRNGFTTINADVVCQNDDFDAWVEDGVKRLRHRVNWKQERGEPYLFYCLTVKGGVLDYEIMTLDECDKIRERSRAKNAGPWVTDTNEMRKKCPIRRMSKRWDLLPEIRDLIYADDDTPADIAKPVVSRPVFTLPPVQSEPENGTKSAGTAAEARQKSEPEKEPEGDRPAAFNPLKSVRNLCKMSSVQEGELLGWLTATDKTDGSQSSLDEVPSEVLAAVSQNWASGGDVLKAILAARGEQGRLV